jgi:tetratricopeptide (TPR) repeat protein
MEELKKAVELDPDDIGYRGNLAYIYLNRGMYGEMRKELVEILNLEPEDPEAKGMMKALDAENLPPAGKKKPASKKGKRARGAKAKKK